MAEERGPTPTNQSPLPIIHAYEWAVKLGFKTIPLRWRSKQLFPGISYDDHDRGRDFWMQNRAGIGLLLGFGNVVDVDLDCEEAVALAPRFLPDTPAVFGHEVKPRSHYLYRCADKPMTRKITDPASLDEGGKPSTVLELRASERSHTNLPGNLHAEHGAEVKWNEGAWPEPATVDYETLSRAVSKIALAVLLIRHFWLEGQRSEVNLCVAGMLAMREWTEDETVQFVEVILDFTGDDDYSRIQTIRAAFANLENDKKTRGLTSLAKFSPNEALIGTIRDLLGGAMAGVVEEYNEHFAEIDLGGKQRIVALARLRAGVFQPMDCDNFRGFQAHDRIPTPDGKSIRKADVWLTHVKRLRYAGVTFEPGEPEVVEQSDEPKLNIWPGWACEAADLKSQEANEREPATCVVWLRHLREVICGGDDTKYRWVLSWFASIVKEPRFLPGTALLITGRQGSGKSMWLDYFGEGILGKSYLTIAQSGRLVDRFNSLTAQTLLLHSAEATHAKTQAQDKGLIKSVITDRTRIIENKGDPAYSIPNYMRLVMTSNHKFEGASLEFGDRRHTIIDMGDRMISDDGIKALVKERENGGPSALLAFLRAYDKYDPDMIRRNLKNKEHTEMAAVGTSPLQRWWFEVLKEGRLLDNEHRWIGIPVTVKGPPPQSAFLVDWPETVCKSAFYYYAKEDMKMRSGYRGADIAEGQFWSEMYDMLGFRKAPPRASLLFRAKLNPNIEENWPQAAVFDPGDPRWWRKFGVFDRHNALRGFPTLDECRKAFQRVAATPVEWESPEPELTPDPDEPKPKKRKAKSHRSY